MRDRVGFSQHYRPLSLYDYSILLGIPAAIYCCYPLHVFNLPTLGPWLAMIAGLFGMGWALKVLGVIIQVFTREGYKTAIEDLRLLCIGKADFRTGYPENERDLLAAAIVTLESRHP